MVQDNAPCSFEGDAASNLSFQTAKGDVDASAAAEECGNREMLQVLFWVGLEQEEFAALVWKS